MNALRPDTVMVSIMTANNEIGTIQPIAELGELLKNHPAYFHTDAVQAFGQIPIKPEEWHIDMLSASSHKFHGPKGAGFLYVRDGIRLPSFLHGGNRKEDSVPGRKMSQQSWEWEKQRRSQHRRWLSETKENEHCGII